MHRLIHTHTHPFIHTFTVDICLSITCLCWKKVREIIYCTLFSNFSNLLSVTQCTQWLDFSLQELIFIVPFPYHSDADNACI